MPLNPAFLSLADIFLKDLSLMFLLTVIVIPAVLMPLKAFVLIFIAFVRLRRIFVSFPAPVNAFALSFVIVFGNETLVMFLQFANAFADIATTLYLIPSAFAYESILTVVFVEDTFVTDAVPFELTRTVSFAPELVVAVSVYEDDELELPPPPPELLEELLDEDELLLLEEVVVVVLVVLLAG